jgi:hypothetical protein
MRLPASKEHSSSHARLRPRRMHVSTETCATKTKQLVIPCMPDADEIGTARDRVRVLRLEHEHKPLLS